MEFELIADESNGNWLTVKEEVGERPAITLKVNQAHPFMRAYCELPGTELEPVYRVAIALGLGQALARQGGAKMPYLVVHAVNQLLRSYLSKKVALMTDQQLVQILTDGTGPTDPLSRWSPIVGPETLSVVESALSDEKERSRVLKETRHILARCIDPGSSSADGSSAGLVIGQVQSGKTLSFTALTAMARDNRIPLVILLAGTKTNLHEQTVERLRSDLRVERDAGMSPWAIMSNPDDSPTAVADLAKQIKNALKEGTKDQFRKTTVITVMKNKNRINTLAGLLAKLPSQGVNLAKLPVILIDDEADQAGMNAGKGDGGPKSDTPTYSTIVELRSKVPNNTYVMYTATPQAPLLISLADSLSPEFVNVLTPGDGYTGGEDFFGPDVTGFVTVMSADEIIDALDTSRGAPPDSLKDGLATFLLAKTQMPDEILSMLVHPSHTKDLHTIYEGYVNSLMNAWAILLETPGPDRDELVQDHFVPAATRLVRAGRRLPPLDQMLEELPDWMSVTKVRVVNSDKTGDLTWHEAPAWIVIGGNALDRGFTISGSRRHLHAPRGRRRQRRHDSATCQVLRIQEGLSRSLSRLDVE
ncbi:Z1 domain-containing protein [Aeromicrobium sp. UC242_57]|uniref:Z1 domain-containing protein n=1 Tax=Aeromicrobium sp. UC242_57 TaxID=3374624 RepID=UPI00378EF05C